MALELCQFFASAQYLANELIEFHQILYIYWYWQYLGWDLLQSYGPWFMSEFLFTTKFLFRSISWEHCDRISPNFMYALILTRSTFGLLHIIFRTFVPELWPLIDAKLSFPLNILNESTEFHHFIDKIYVGIVTHHCNTSFLPICTRVIALDWHHNFVSAWEQIDRIPRCLMWVCTVCLCPTKRKLVLYGVNVLHNETQCR